MSVELQMLDAFLITVTTKNTTTFGLTLHSMIHISQLQHQDTLFFLLADRGSTFLQQSINFYQTTRHHGSENTIIYNSCVFKTDNVDSCSLLPPPNACACSHVRARTHAPHTGAIVYSYSEDVIFQTTVMYKKFLNMVCHKNCNVVRAFVEYF
jgi:hypothetical protein